MNLAERMLLTESVLQRFRNQRFNWRTASCIHLAHAQVSAFGHDVPEIPRFNTPRGAKRALAEMGAASVTELLDLYLPRRQAPAFARVGDLLIGPAAEQHGLEAVGIADGQGNVFGWHEATNFEKLEAILQVRSDITVAFAVGGI